MKLVFDDPDFDNQFQRTVAKGDHGMANPGECLAIAAGIKEGDTESWYSAFYGFAERLRASAGAALDAGHRVSARGQFLRACEYFRAAFFYDRAKLGDARLHRAYEASRECFREAMPLLDHAVEVFEVSGPDGTYGGYLASPPASEPCATVVAPGGYDGTAEEAYPVIKEAVQRGYAAYVFDGPGQGATLYEQRVVMRPDWEAVLPPVIDAISARPEVDSDAIVLLGRSFGGYLAPRAASGEGRLAALVVDPGQFDLGAPLRERLPAELLARIDEDSTDAEQAFQGLLEAEPLRRLLLPRMATHGCETVQAYARTMRDYTNEGRAQRITCPTLVCDNETDIVSTGQGQLLYEHLTCPKEFVRFTAAEGAEGHCEGMGAVVFFARAFDWIDETLAGR